MLLVNRLAHAGVGAHPSDGAVVYTVQEICQLYLYPAPRWSASGDIHGSFIWLPSTLESYMITSIEDSLCALSQDGGLSFGVCDSGLFA